jgi:hypothetical protein
MGDDCRSAAARAPGDEPPMNGIMPWYVNALPVPDLSLSCSLVSIVHSCCHRHTHTSQVSQ